MYLRFNRYYFVHGYFLTTQKVITITAAMQPISRITRVAIKQMLTSMSGLPTPKLWEANSDKAWSLLIFMAAAARAGFFLNIH